MTGPAQTVFEGEIDLPGDDPADRSSASVTPPV
jgi:hypothetical protein